MTWNEPAWFWLHWWSDRFNAARLEMSHLAMSATQSRSLLGCFWWGDTLCNSLIEWRLSRTEPPVSSLCENMLMQIDANDVVLYMQISHATTLWLLFFGTGELWMFMWMLRSVSLCLGVCLGCLCEDGYFHKATNAINIPSPINLKVLACFTAWLSSGSEKHSHRVLGCWSLKPQISDLYLLRNPNIVWLFLKSFSFIWQLAEKGSLKRQVGGSEIRATLWISKG